MTPPATSPVATPAQWLEGARPRTLPAAVSPVLAGTGVAAYVDARGLVEGAAGAAWSRSRCRSASTTPTTTPTASAAPTPTGSGRCGWSGPASPSPGQVKTAAFAGVRGRRRSPGWCSPRRPRGGCCAVGALCVVAAWFYTGGSRPYGYHGARRGDGVRVLRAGRGPRDDVRPDRDVARSPRGSRPSASGRWPARSWSPTTSATSRPTARSGKRTLAVVLGDSESRYLYVLLVCGRAGDAAGPGGRDLGPGAARVAVPAAGGSGHPPGPHRYDGPGLVPVLQQTGLAELIYALGIFVGLLLAG